MAVTVDLQNFFILAEAVKEWLYFLDPVERRPTPNLSLKLLQLLNNILGGFSGGNSGQLFWRVMQQYILLRILPRIFDDSCGKAVRV